MQRPLIDAEPDRVAYIDQHLRAAHDAASRGVDLRGYLVWSFLDSFEWAEVPDGAPAGRQEGDGR